MKYRFVSRASILKYSHRPKVRCIAVTTGIIVETCAAYRAREIPFASEITTALVPSTENHLSPINCSMDKFISVITRFPLPVGATADQIRAAFDEAAPKFRNVPGLVRKQFLHSKDGRTAGGVYLWNDERAARAFMNERVAPMIRAKFQVDPSIEFYDSPVIVEN
jgi:heme-degrading monooxygenase HmoA